jgi:hypothetical protein
MTEKVDGTIVIDGDPKALAEELGEAANAPIGPNIGVASIALNMALKYHDINTVQDGQLYQQYKLEGRNMQNLHLDHVFDTAVRIEAHLIGAHRRVTALLLNAMEDLDVMEAEAKGQPAQEGTPETDADPANPNVKP